MGKDSAMNDKILIVMCGAPGSGKSTLADELAYDFGFPIVCPDNIREELFGDASDQSDGWRVFQIAYTRLKEALSDDDVPGAIFDATNCRRKARRDVLDEAYGNFDYSICAVSDADLNTCLARNAGRSRIVPDDIIEKMHANLQMNWPDTSEGFDEVIDADELYGRISEICGY